jgi:hypothetical protein
MRLNILQTGDVKSMPFRKQFYQTCTILKVWRVFTRVVVRFENDGGF